MAVIDPFTGHQLWAEVYDAFPNPLLALEQRELSRWLGSLEGLSVADIGCGTGRWMRQAWSLRARSVVGIDFSPKMIAQAAQKPDLSGNLILADIGRMPLKSFSLDLVVCGFVLGYLPALDGVVKEIHRILKPNGSLFCSDFHPSAHGHGWKRAFKSAGQNIEIANTHRPPAEIESTFGKHFNLQRQAGLELDESERSLFQKAEKLELFEQAKNIPAVILFHWRKLH
jgi:malonyl-CoA O-methyltransferase